MSGSPLAAVFADVHGNYLALQACLELARARGARQYLFLGDYITDHAYPQRVMELLYEARERHSCIFIRGNREEYMTGYRRRGGCQPDGTPWRDSSAQGALLSCYENLTAKDLDWFESLPIYSEWRPQGAPPVALCHGAPSHVRGVMRGDPDFYQELAGLGPDLLLKGHNHKWFSLTYKGKRVVCAGSVGNPITRRTRPGGQEVTELAKVAQMLFLRLEQGRWKPELVRVPYDWQGALNNLKTSGLWQRAAVWAALLRHNTLTGTDPCGAVPSRAAELYRQETGTEAPWPQVPEEYWQRAAEEFGIDLAWS